MDSELARTSLMIETMPSWLDTDSVMHNVLASRDLVRLEAESWRGLGALIEARGGRIWHWLIRCNLRLDVKVAMMARMVMNTDAGMMTSPLRTRSERALACYLLAEELENEFAPPPGAQP